MHQELPTATLSSNVLPVNSLRNDRRDFVRQPTNDLCELVINLRGRKVTCRVTNISAGGAMIEASHNFLPKRFVLENPAKDIRVICTIVWTSKSFSGVKFNKVIDT